MYTHTVYQYSFLTTVGFPILRRLSLTLTSPPTPWGLNHGNTSVMWSAISTSPFLEYSTTQSLRKCLSSTKGEVWTHCPDINAAVNNQTPSKRTDLYYWKRNYFLQPQFPFYLHSPSICHSDSDLSDGSKKYSPSSETSVETQRACGKERLSLQYSTYTFPQ